VSDSEVESQHGRQQDRRLLPPARQYQQEGGDSDEGESEGTDVADGFEQVVGYRDDSCRCYESDRYNRYAVLGEFSEGGNSTDSAQSSG